MDQIRARLDRVERNIRRIWWVLFILVCFRVADGYFGFQFLSR